MMYAYPSQTEKGLRYASYSMILFLVAALLGVVLIVALMPILAAVLTMPPGGTPDPSIIGAALGVLAAACALVVVELIALILGLVGLIAIHRGKMEFGPEHSQKVDRAVLVLVFGIVLPIIGGAVAGSIGSLASTVSVVSVAGTITTIDTDDTRRIATADYHDWILQVDGLDGKQFNFYADNGINEGGLEMEASDDGNLAYRAEIMSTWDGADLTTSPFRIKIMTGISS